MVSYMKQLVKMEGKQKRKSYSLSEKVAIICELEKGASQSELAKNKDIPISTINDFWKNKSKILSDSASVKSKAKRVKKCGFPKTDLALIKWFDVQRSRNLPITGPILLEKAKQFSQELGEVEFQASRGFLHNWKKRHGISFSSVTGESGAVDPNVVSSWLNDVWPVIKDGYELKDIFNCDETGLFFKLLPNKTMNRKGMSCKGGKLSKERVTLLLCANADGSEKLKPLVVGKCENPRCFKSVNKKRLPVDYYWNTKAWMTQLIFSSWLKKLDLRMRFQKQKIILLLDNCQPHLIKMNLKNVKLVYFPPNVTSLLQPMDQGIINETKKLYRSLILRQLIEGFDNNTLVKIDLLEAVMTVALAWNQLRQGIIKKCFQHSKITHESSMNIDEILDVSQDIEIQSKEQLNLSEVEIQEYFKVDQMLETYEHPSDSDIVAEVLVQEGLSQTEDHTSEGEDDPEIIREIPTLLSAQLGLQNFKLWLISQDGDAEDDLLKSIHSLETYMGNYKSSKMRQCFLDEFFGVKE